MPPLPYPLPCTSCGTIPKVVDDSGDYKWGHYVAHRNNYYVRCSCGNAMGPYRISWASAVAAWDELIKRERVV